MRNHYFQITHGGLLNIQRNSSHTMNTVFHNSHTILLIAVIWLLSSCEPFVALNLYLPTEKKSVYCFLPDRNQEARKDTSIYFLPDDLTLVKLYSESNGHSSGWIDLGMGDVDVLFNDWKVDTVSLFIFDQEVIDNNSWNTVVDNYMVLQRYDFTKEDLKRIHCQVYYPPTPEMSTIRMWPNYH